MHNSDPDLPIFYVADGFETALVHDPLEIYIRRTGSDDRVPSFNSRGLFDFEQLRLKGNGEDKVEKFSSHTDTRPDGAEIVYVSPEHASTSLPDYFRILLDPYMLNAKVVICRGEYGVSRPGGVCWPQRVGMHMLRRSYAEGSMAFGV